VRPGNRLADIFLGLLGRVTRLLGLAAGTQAVVAQLHRLVRRTAQERLRIGVGADGLHALHVARDHVLHRVAAAAAHAYDLDQRALVEFFGFDHFDGHVTAPG